MPPPEIGCRQSCYRLLQVVTVPSSPLVANAAAGSCRWSPLAVHHCQHCGQQLRAVSAHHHGAPPQSQEALVIQGIAFISHFKNKFHNKTTEYVGIVGYENGSRHLRSLTMMHTHSHICIELCVRMGINRPLSPMFHYYMLF